MDLNTGNSFSKNPAPFGGVPVRPAISADRQAGRPKDIPQGFVQLAKTSEFMPTDRFAAKLKELVAPGLPAKELIGKIVIAALEAEFGPGFTRSKGFDKMVNTISDTIVANPDLRRQSLSIASRYMEKGIVVTDQKKANNDKKN